MEDHPDFERVAANLARHVHRHHDTHPDALCRRRCLRNFAHRNRPLIDDAIAYAATEGWVTALIDGGGWPRWGPGEKPPAGAGGRSSRDHVYIIANSVNQLVKIGRSHDPRKRLADIRTMSPVPLETIAVFDAAGHTETELHTEFGALRHHGEWFDFGNHCPIEAVSRVLGVEPSFTRPWLNR
jgi:hypothetical protein